MKMSNLDEPQRVKPSIAEGEDEGQISDSSSASTPSLPSTSVSSDLADSEQTSSSASSSSSSDSDSESHFIPRDISPGDQFRFAKIRGRADIANRTVHTDDGEDDAAFGLDDDDAKPRETARPLPRKG